MFTNIIFINLAAFHNMPYVSGIIRLSSFGLTFSSLCSNACCIALILLQFVFTIVIEYVFLICTAVMFDTTFYSVY